MKFRSSMLAISLILIAVLLILFLLGKKSVHQELIIEASAAKVWSVLTDFESIENWNKVLIPVEGSLKEGAKITYRFHQDATTESLIPARVISIIPDKLLNQKGGVTGILTFDHKYILEPEGEFVKLIIHEEYRGIAVPFWNPQPVENAYGRLAKALRKYVLTSDNSL